MSAIRWKILVAACAGAVFVTPARGEIDCYGSLASYRLSHPNLNCTCSSARSMPSCRGTDGSGSYSTRSTKGKYASARASMAASLFGTVLEAVLASPGPSPANLEHERQQAERQRQQAEAERLAAQERAREAEEKHRKLLGSLSSLPGAQPSASATAAAGVRLTALDAVGPSPAGVGMSQVPDLGRAAPGFVTDEAAREWLAGPETLFSAAWKPLPVAPPVPATPVTLPTCSKSAQGCEIKLPAVPSTPRIGAGKPPTRVVALSPEPEAVKRTVRLLRPPSCVAPCDDETDYLRAWAAAGLPPEARRAATLVTLVDRLKETGKILVESIALMALDAVPNENLASGVKVVYSVGEAADTVLKDALKVAGYAGTRNTPPPELIPFEETAAPFAGDPEDLRKLLSGGKDKNKGINTLVVESAWLAQKLRRVWQAQQ